MTVLHKQGNFLFHTILVARVRKQEVTDASKWQLQIGSINKDSSSLGIYFFALKHGFKITMFIL